MIDNKPPKKYALIKKEFFNEMKTLDIERSNI